MCRLVGMGLCDKMGLCVGLGVCLDGGVWDCVEFSFFRKVTPVCHNSRTIIVYNCIAESDVGWKSLIKLPVKT